MRDLNYYQVLGIAADAPGHEVRAAYARLVKRHHPDTHGALPHRLPEIQQAYRCLSDPAERARHDRHIAEVAREHHERQRRLHQRLDRYDRRHPLPASPDRRRWQRIAIVFVVSLVAIGLAGEWLNVPTLEWPR